MKLHEQLKVIEDWCEENKYTLRSVSLSEGSPTGTIYGIVVGVNIFHGYVYVNKENKVIFTEMKLRINE